MNNFIDLSIFTIQDAKNNKRYEMPGAVYNETKMIPISSIDTDHRNSVRKGGMSEYGEHVDKLKICFTKGVDPEKPLPIVERIEPYHNPDGSICEYGSIDGHHRLIALRELGVNEYPCDIYEFKNEPTKRIFQIHMNNHAPARNNTDSDIITNYADLINNHGDFKDNNGDLDLDALEESLSKHTFYKQSKSKMEKIIHSILQASNVQTKNINYTNDKGENWIGKHMPTRKLGSKGGDLWIFKSSTWERTYQRMKRAIFNERQNGNIRTHDIILNVEATLHGDVKKCREKFINDIQLAFDVDSFLTDGKNDKSTMEKYFKISYALPQVKHDEDMHKPVIL